MCPPPRYYTLERYVLSTITIHGICKQGGCFKKEAKRNQHQCFQTAERLLFSKRVQQSLLPLTNVTPKQYDTSFQGPRCISFELEHKTDKLTGGCSQTIAIIVHSNPWLN